jgi:hypothetical protein
VALLVDVAAAGAPPQVTPLATASFAWRTFDLHLLAGDDPAPALAALLPGPRDRRQTLTKVVATGRAGLAARTALMEEIARALPDFAWLELDEAGLATECDVEDLDRIDRAGALREAANALLAESGDASRSATDRAIAAAALTRLYGYAQAVSQ